MAITERLLWCGKPPLLKTLSHCWPWFKGDISSPADSWYVSQTPLIKSGLLKEIICKALPLPVDDKSLSEVLHQVGLGKLQRIGLTTIAGEIFFPAAKNNVSPWHHSTNFTTSEMDISDETTSHLKERTRGYPLTAFSA
ncbi:hypothetical protein ACLB1T_27280 [Escherichia coli]